MFRILFPTDGSPSALRAAHYAAQLCSALKEASVTILYVKERGITTFAMPVAGNPPEMTIPSTAADWTKVQQALESVAQKALSDTGGAFKGIDSPIRVAVEVGKPAVVICRVAETQGFDMIVMGSRGLGELSGLVLGSVSNQVVHNSQVPVLVVH